MLEFLETHPHAEELRTLIECVRRGQVPLTAATDLDVRGTTMCLLDDSGRCVWWHYEDDGEVLVLDGID